MKVSIINRIYQPANTQDVELQEILKFIKTGVCFGQDLRVPTELIRNEADHDKQNQMKYRNLPAALFNGTFSYKNNDNCTSYSCFTAMDFDNFASEDDLQRIGYRLTITPCVYAVFRTPSGNGLKAIVAHDNSDPKHHEELYGQLLQKFNLPTTDASVCDLSRGNYLCYDPNLWVNERCVPFHFVHDLNFNPKQKVISSSSGTIRDIDMLKLMLSLKVIEGNKSDESIINILNAYWKKKPDRWKVGNRANSVFRASSELCNAGVNMDKAVDYLITAYLPTGLCKDEIIYHAQRGYQNNAVNYGIYRHKFDGYGSKGKKKV